ncbi:MAG: T9SS type A sorting domain-containing protein [Chitinophagales bacterium]
MKRIYLSLLVLFFSAASVKTYAQALGTSCPGCAVNTSLFNNPTDFDVALKPDTIVVTQGDTVDFDVTYLFPKKVQASGITADVSSVQIISVANSPIGLKMTCSSPANNCTYYPQTNRYGCVKVCGRTLESPGVRLVTIVVNGCGTALGQTQCQNQNVYVPLKILPGAVAFNPCFTKSAASGCGPTSVTFTATPNTCCLDPNLHPCKYKWDFGSGYSDTTLTPPVQIFANSGVHYVKLKKYGMKYVVTRVAISDYAGSGGSHFWCGDVEEVNLPILGCTSKPDFSGTISPIGANLPEVSDNLSATWNNLNYEVTNNLLTFSFQDDDAVSQPDQAGATSINVTGPGQYNITTVAPGGGGGVTGSVTIALQVKDSTEILDSVVIYDFPDTAMVLANKDSACDVDSIRLSLDADFSANAIQWYKDDTILIAGANDSIFWAHESGSYSVEILNTTTFCKSKSAGHAVAFGQSAPVSTNAVFDAASNQFFLNPFPGGFKARWYKDNLQISGQEGRFLPNLGPGTYYAEVYNPNFPMCSVTSGSAVLTGIGNESAANDIASLEVFPNPNNGRFQIKANTFTAVEVKLEVTDMVGRVIWSENMGNRNGEFSKEFDFSSVTKGVYFVHVETANGKMTKRVSIQ